MKKLSFSTVSFVLLFFCVTSAQAIGVDVDYVYSGSPGNYVLDFTVCNNITPPNTHSIYFWGVDLTSSGMNSPTGWSQGSSYNTAGSGGWDITYSSTWGLPYLGHPNSIYPGNSLSGFTLNYQADNLPETIHFFAYGWKDPKLDGSTYISEEGDGSFIHYANNPGFQGIARAAPVPEPATMLLLGTGLVGLAGMGRKKFFKK